ncbi:MAG: (Fe-S)-binding protein [Alphaproteobacteria bacterium]|nr:(Fe-S)-binding protein [Alphaproteobacteria bacterium]
MQKTEAKRPKAGLFVTCLIDVFRPSVGMAAARLIELSGCDVVVPRAQTCCGQPAYNSGDLADTTAIAANTITAFEDCDYVVVPSGSCSGMLKKHYPRLFEGDPAAQSRATQFANKVHELISFLVDERGLKKVNGEFNGTVTYHDSCSGLRELGIKTQPRELLTSLKGLTLTEMAECEVCCGFGGTFSVKFPDISNAMVEKKSANITAVEPDLLLAGDLGCLMNIAGKLKRQGRHIACRHVAEVLAGELSAPPIAAARAAALRTGERPAIL